MRSENMITIERRMMTQTKRTLRQPRGSTQHSAQGGGGGYLKTQTTRDRENQPGEHKRRQRTRRSLRRSRRAVYKDTAMAERKGAKKVPPTRLSTRRGTRLHRRRRQPDPAQKAVSYSFLHLPKPSSLIPSLPSPTASSPPVLTSLSSRLPFFSTPRDPEARTFGNRSKHKTNRTEEYKSSSQEVRTERKNKGRPRKRPGC